MGSDKLSPQSVANREAQTSGGQVWISTMTGQTVAVNNGGRNGRSDWPLCGTEPAQQKTWRQAGQQLDPTWAHSLIAPVHNTIPPNSVCMCVCASSTHPLMGRVFSLKQSNPHCFQICFYLFKAALDQVLSLESHLTYQTKSQNTWLH